MKDYSVMSDFEINVNVSLELFEGSSGGDVSRVATWCACKENGAYGLFDPCNNPADAWPVIVANNISLHAPRFKEGWMAEFTGSDDDVNDGFNVDYYESLNTNPLRAAMIVFLMMKDRESSHAKTSV
ncbi:TPA: phage protein NinX family protein [Yersinia enterocolitica]|uniref:phage protein NinX family protein n=2 Tax=Yersinia enterocolitica TaxID=630 RepID=UPI00330D77FC|nr:DUF2591 family protein [Yersinia enterocolitica]HDL8557643.1 DUF2591 family protein [Yersinia enterocolitica]HDM8444612.1 DUF2591 family protein [Yersinia enterocolitica]